MQTHTVELKGYGVIADINYVPYRPAPSCQNHDSPAFSDPGDDEEFEVIAVKSAEGEDLSELIEAIDGWDALTKLAREKFDVRDYQ